MDKRRKERLDARRLAGLTREQRLREAWRTTGDLDAAEELTRLLSEEPSPRCQDCGAVLDPDRFDEENPERLGELDLLKYGPGPVCPRCWDARERLRRVEEDDSPDLAYVYAAALYCAPCGLDVRRRLEREGKAPKPSEVLDERSYDSGHYPKGPVPRGGGESDSPELCASGAECLRALELEDGRHGAWLGNDLTSEGMEWLREALLERPTPLVLFWARSYDVDLPGELAPHPFSCSRCGREEQRWYGEHSCGECDERFCARCEDEGGSAHGGYHDCGAYCQECSAELEECARCDGRWCPECESCTGCGARGQDDASGNPSWRPRRAIRRNGDRRLERRAARGDRDAEVRLLLRRVQSDEIPAEAVEAAAVLGHPVAKAALRERDDLEPFGEIRLENRRLAAIVRMLGRRDALRWGMDVVRRALPAYESQHPGDGRPRRVVEVAADLLGPVDPLGWIGPEGMIGKIEAASLGAFQAEEGAKANTAARAAASAAMALCGGLQHVGCPVSFDVAGWLTTQLWGAANDAAAVAWRLAPYEREAYKADEEAWILRRLAGYVLAEIPGAEPFVEGDGGADWRMLLERQRENKREFTERMNSLLDEAIKREVGRRSDADA